MEAINKSILFSTAWCDRVLTDQCGSHMCVDVADVAF